MKVQLGPAAPAAGSAESEALRRYRSFLCTALVRGESPPPALDGLRLQERRVMALIDAWSAAAAAARTDPSGGENGGAELVRTLAPYAEQFRMAVRTSSGGRQRRGRPRASRRAVVAAIDRVADAFLAVDTETAEIVDANPAAGSLLGVDRDALLGVESLRFVDAAGRDAWWSALDAVNEGGDTHRFGARLLDARGSALDVDATATWFASKGRGLALLMLRPRGLAPHAPAPGAPTAGVGGP